MTSGRDTNQGQLVPEAILKRKHDVDSIKAKRLSAELQKPRGNKKVFSKSKNSIQVRKPENFLHHGRMKKNHTLRYRRVRRKGMQNRAAQEKVIATKEVVDDEGEDMRQIHYASNSYGSPFVFAIRIRNRIGEPNCVRRVLRSLRLTVANEGVFLPYNDSTRKQLHLVEPYVVYGVPSRTTVKDLIIRRGHGKLIIGPKTERRIPLSDNTVVEEHLGPDIICVDDVVHELCTQGKKFSTVSAFLAPFCLSPPISKFEMQKLDTKITDDYGDKGERIDEYIRSML